jgi:predicted MFS family arabinose efflux permease
MIAPAAPRPKSDAPVAAGRISVPLAGITVAHGLFGFGYVITATFLVTIVRDTPQVRSIEPWIWMLVGLAAIPSVPLWQWLGRRIGLFGAYAAAAAVEALAVAASVEWVSLTGICVSAVLLGGTFMGLTALGLMCARELAKGSPQRAIGLTTASFGLGQMIGPSVAGYLSEQTGSLRAASLLAVAALLIAAVLVTLTSPRETASR